MKRKRARSLGVRAGAQKADDEAAAPREMPEGEVRSPASSDGYPGGQQWGGKEGEKGEETGSSWQRARKRCRGDTCSQVPSYKCLESQHSLPPMKWEH